MVISVGSAPAHFTLDPSLGEFVLTQPALSIPASGTIYSINEGNASLWDGPTTRCARRIPPSLRRPDVRAPPDAALARSGASNQACASAAGAHSPTLILPT